VNEPQQQAASEGSNVIDLDRAKATSQTIDLSSELELDHPSLYLNRELTWLAMNSL